MSGRRGGKTRAQEVARMRAAERKRRDAQREAEYQAFMADRLEAQQLIDRADRGELSRQSLDALAKAGFKVAKARLYAPGDDDGEGQDGRLG